MEPMEPKLQLTPDELGVLLRASKDQIVSLIRELKPFHHTYDETISDCHQLLSANKKLHDEAIRIT